MENLSVFPAGSNAAQAQQINVGHEPSLPAKRISTHPSFKGIPIYVQDAIIYSERALHTYEENFAGKWENRTFITENAFFTVEIKSFLGESRRRTQCEKFFVEIISRRVVQKELSEIATDPIMSVGTSIGLVRKRERLTQANSKCAFHILRKPFSSFLMEIYFRLRPVCPHEKIIY